jgi:hypothetical protein
MTFGAVIFAVVLLGMIAFLVLRPLFATDAPEGELLASELDAGEAIAHLRTRLEGLITSIHDLDFDYDTSKVSTEVYAEQRKFLIGRAVSTLIQLDQAEAHLSEVDGDIEAAITRYRAIKAEVS